MSTPKIITFWPYPPPGNENLDVLSNAVPYPEYSYLSTSTFLVKLTAPNHAFCTVILSSLLLMLAILIILYTM